MENQISDFANSFRQLLDDTGLFNRNQWCHFLGVNEIKLNQWLNDEAIPTPSNLFMVFAALERSSNIPQKPIEHFKTIATRHAVEVSPFGEKMIPTIWDYMMKPRFL